MRGNDILNQTPYCCPFCRSGRYVTYRRTLAGEGITVTRCQCRRCRMEFEVHESEKGRRAGS